MQLFLCWSYPTSNNWAFVAIQVKTQRALNDYRKSAFPHYKDELTRLRYIGAITANRLKDARAWLGKDVPIECVDNVQSLKQLLEYADTNRSADCCAHQLMQTVAGGCCLRPAV